MAASPSAVILELKKIKSLTISIVSPNLPWSDGTRCHDLRFLNLAFWASFFSLLFHFNQEALSFSFLTAIMVVSSAYVRLLMFFPEQFSWVPLPYCSPPGCPFPIKPLTLSAHVSPQTIHFRMLNKSPVLALEGVPLPATNGNSGGNSSSLRLTSWPLGVLRGQLACQWTRPSGRNWDPFVPGLLLKCATGKSAPTGKVKEILLTSLSFPLSFLSLTLPILLCFSSPLVLDAEVWSKGPQPELRIGDWSAPLGRELEFWFWSGLIPGRAKFQSSLLWRPGEKSHNAWVSVGGKRHL